MKIVVDFDGTCVTHDFPAVGRDIGAAEVLKELVEEGHHLILFTMRSDAHSIGEEYANEIGIAASPSSDYLSDALDWFKKNDIPLYGVQTDPDQKNWTSSPKAYGHIHIDDAALGCPLRSDPELSNKLFVDWPAVRSMLAARGILKAVK